MSVFPGGQTEITLRQISGRYFEMTRFLDQMLVDLCQYKHTDLLFIGLVNHCKTSSANDLVERECFILRGNRDESTAVEYEEIRNGIM